MTTTAVVKYQHQLNSTNQLSCSAGGSAADYCGNQGDPCGGDDWAYDFTNNVNDCVNPGQDSCAEGCNLCLRLNPNSGSGCALSTSTQNPCPIFKGTTATLSWTSDPAPSNPTAGNSIDINCTYPVAPSSLSPDDITSYFTLPNLDGNSAVAQTFMTQVMTPYCGQSISACPKDPVTGQAMASCSRFVATDGSGDICRQWVAGTGPNTNPSLFSQRKQTDVDYAMTQYCSNNSNAADCQCINRLNSKTYQQLLGVVGNDVPANCWYLPCTVNQSSQELVRSVDVGQCPQNINVCQSIVNFVENGGGSANIGPISQVVSCTFPPPAPANATYNCDGKGNCTQATGGTGKYSSLSSCQNACPAPASQTWNCTSAGCIGLTDNTGTYNSLSSCTAACAAPTPKPTPSPNPTPTPSTSKPWYKSTIAIILYIVVGLIILGLLIWLLFYAFSGPSKPAVTVASTHTKVSTTSK